MNEREEYFCKIPMTIERRLKQYSECLNHTERHETLWHEWNHNKRWLTQIQKLILSSFPSYSMHDASHSETVLHNIELILGEKNICELSPTDCFLILHTVYIHDIGMCITHEDRKNILKDKRFHEYLKKTKNNTRGDLSKYAEILLMRCEEIEDLTELSIEALLKKKLDIYYAIIYLLADYRRREHGDVSKERLINWINNPDKLGSGFSTMEIPERLYYIIAYCANTHTKWDFDEVLNLHQEDTGYALDYVHPRFIAVLLQLGDALDMDNNRFHPLIHEYMGELPEDSEAHYRKHKSIRRLRITNEKISISANCDSQRELRLVRQECDGIRSILQKVSYYWSVIRPKEQNIGLPTLDKTVLTLKGVEIPEKLVQAQFEIPQDKAFNLLEGNGFYLNEKFAFLRELFQNAVDATKLQYFRDCKRRMGNTEDNLDLTPWKLNEILPSTQYPIQIELIITGYENGKEIPLNQEMQQPDDKKYGVLVKIRDYGTGISQKDIIKIANVGSSYESRKSEIEKMPKWLQPTGLFGIGLQSVFLSAEVLSAKTLTRNGEGYEIHFYPRAKNVNGYINVTPYQNINEYEPYGTCFEVFIPNSKKLRHINSPESWDGRDPFEENYEKTSAIRHARELVKQFAYYLTELIGEPLFPVSLCISDMYGDDLKSVYNDDFLNHFNNTMTVSVNGGKNKSISLVSGKVIWAYETKKEEFYKLDLENVKLYLWNKEYNAYACLGIDRIWEIKKQMSNLNYSVSPLDVKMKIFYKGIKVTETMALEKDASLIEFIDLKDTLESDYLKLNRNGFSEKGIHYVNEVYEGILMTAKHALRKISDQKDILEKLEGHFKKLLDQEEKERDIEKTQKYALSVAALAYFAMVNEREVVNEWEGNQESKKWNDLIVQFLELKNLKDGSRIQESFVKLIKSSSLFYMTYYKEEKGVLSKSDDMLSILDLINSNRKYAIVSERRDKSHYWNEWIVEIEKSFFDDIYSKIRMLDKTDTIYDGIRLMQEIDAECEKLTDKTDLTFGTFDQEQKQMPIIRWFLQNVPTIALWTSEKDNIRVNILNLETDGSIYMSARMRQLVLDRIYEVGKKSGIQRFSTHIWSGYNQLGLTKNRQSIKFVTRGKYSNAVSKEMIVPLTYDQIKKMKMEKEKTDMETKLKLFYKNFCDPVNKYLRELPEAEAKQTMDSFWRIVQRDYENRKNMSSGNERVFNTKAEGTDFPLTDEDCKILFDTLEEKKDISEIEIYIKLKERLFELKEAWLNYAEYETRYVDLYRSIVGDSQNYKNMISYIARNADQRPGKERIEHLYCRCVYEYGYVLFEKQKKVFLDEIQKEMQKRNIDNLYREFVWFLSRKIE